MAKSRAQYISEKATADDFSNITFDLVDEATVKRLQKDKKINVPKKKVDIPKDKRWNEKQMASKILQGIQNGDSIPKMSKAMTEVIGNNLTSAIRNTRTMTTSAECNGRLDSYKNLADQGVVQKKVWMATPDDRTRPTHIDLDGEEQDIDKAFSNGCQFPGDGNGPAEEVWQCRCTMTDHIIGFKRADGSISYVDYDRDKTLHDEQMEEEKEKRTSKDTSTHTVVDGKDISTTWKRRADKFDFGIEDVINAQGFDGLPRVLSAEEFEEKANKTGIIAKRGYTAPSAEIAKEYHEQLMNGKFYVDCSEGGSAYGRGMYAAYAKKGDKYAHEMMSNTVERYSSSAKGTGVIETFTIDESAKIINYKDAQKLAEQYRDSWREEGKKQAFKKAADDLSESLKLNQNEKNYMFDRFFDLKTENEDETIKWYKNLTGEEKDQLNEKIQEKAKHAFRAIDNFSIDEGTVAALHGYDVIDVERENYFVVLNRTKCIFKGE